MESRYKTGNTHIVWNWVKSAFVWSAPAQLPSLIIGREFSEQNQSGALTGFIRAQLFENCLLWDQSSFFIWLFTAPLFCACLIGSAFFDLYFMFFLIPCPVLLLSYSLPRQLYVGESWVFFSKVTERLGCPRITNPSVPVCVFMNTSGTVKVSSFSLWLPCDGNGGRGVFFDLLECCKTPGWRLILWKLTNSLTNLLTMQPETVCFFISLQI